MRLDIVSIFPEYFAPLDVSLLGKARRRGLVDIHVHDLREWTYDRHRTVDDTPYGGGPGMVMKPDPWGAALDAIIATGDAAIAELPAATRTAFQRLASERTAAERGTTSEPTAERRPSDVVGDPAAGEPSVAPEKPADRAGPATALTDEAERARGIAGGLAPEDQVGSAPTEAGGGAPSPSMAGGVLSGFAAERFTSRTAEGVSGEADQVAGEGVPAAGEGVRVAGEGVVVPRLVVPTPSGRSFTQAKAVELAAEPWLVFACGRYEGIDSRVVEDARERMPVDEVSIGDYVLAGGEAAVLVIVEAVARLLPGVLGNVDSVTDDSFAPGAMETLLEGPVYTKPPVWRGRSVPDVLLSGHHGAIARWRRDQALRRTAANRPELLARADPAALDEHDREVLRDAGLPVHGEDVAH